jgi:hypothetical protein
VLSFEMRAKGMAFSSLAVNAGGLLNQFAWPVALQNIGWKTYIVFIVWCCCQAGIMYRWFPETKNRTVSFSKFEASRFFLTSFSLRNLTTSSEPPTRSRSHWRRRQSWLVSNTVLLSSRRLWLRCMLEKFATKILVVGYLIQRHTDVYISNADSCLLMTY